MSGARQFVYRPAGTLRRYVREILWVRSEQPRLQMLLPETTLTLVLRQSGRVSLHSEDLPCTIVSGLQQRTRVDEHSIQRQFVAVERFLLSRIEPQNGAAISPQIEAAVDLIRRSEGRASVVAIARHAAMSQSALERHFRAAVGATPKTVSRVAR